MCIGIMKEHRDASNKLSIELSNTMDDHLFVCLSDTIIKEFKAKITNKLDGIDQHYWDFNIRENKIVLHSDSMAGISIYAENDSDTELLRKIGQKLFDVVKVSEIQRIEGLASMTVNERLYVSGLMAEFDIAKKNNKNRAKTILRWLGVDEGSIVRIIEV
ncbi:MAG: hypothetical protein IPM32_10885 [Ignavibacteriae bacterium]|nr:hypothetical protein [Ignavibacteriota bacterium]